MRGRRISFEAQDGAYRIALGEEEWILNNVHEVVRLIFGLPPGSESPSPTIPEPFEEVVDVIFPIPRPEYGLRYI